MKCDGAEAVCDVKCVGRVGRVMKLQDNAVLVKFFGVDRVWPINPAVLSPAVLTAVYLIFSFVLHTFIYVMSVESEQSRLISQQVS